ncbi:hypothetical protein Poli38472_008752 [Pythium oligandrum]|uniref:Uncharacterized protein n=1 Tax=Pythium oligandrum TaxID=41045 RepID=A0A8K1C454_PYTOL|nr:hypothetical protein Poli38472_008752 [Pythium oligandrum]|eukprot:TMW56104.1 hypothetical protein Poli38472_008752 [Pythium oligandrum]
MLESAFTFAEAQQELESLVPLTDISEAHPAIVFDWNRHALDAFVGHVNTLLSGTREFPSWMKVEPPHVTAESITYDIVEYLATFGGYTIGRTLDVCDSELYYAHVGCGLLNIEGDLQECINCLPPGQYLATTATLANARRIPLRLKRLNRSRLGVSFRLAFA